MTDEDSTLSGGVPEPTVDYERRARRWNVFVTALLVVILFIPMPFVRFETWPAKAMLGEHLVTPWSRFRICYESFPKGEAVAEVFGFNWRGRLKNGDGTNPQFIHPGSVGPAVLKWQNGPEIILHAAYADGDLIRVETYWQPMILWPFKMIWNIRGHFKVPVKS
ncbi:MAG: hypothetical protein MUF52_05615 [Syntrophobacteraceae bacterium]|nr:hypothetical protein [Syntrophobacteraceae bacterium]